MGKLLKHNFKILFLIALFFVLGTAFGSFYLSKNFQSAKYVEEKNTPKAFLSESYDKIKDNYWDNISDAQIIDLFRIAASKSGLGNLPVKIETKDELLSSLVKAQNELPEDQRKKFIPSLLTNVLSSLNPAGRSGLFTTKQQQQLVNTVSNINPEKNLYRDLELEKGASEDEVNKAYLTMAKQLEKESSPEAKEKLKAIAYAKDVLTDKSRKEKYDSGGIEPTIFTKVLESQILYMQFQKFSPTSYEEFVKAFDSYKDNKDLTGLIFDLRGNVGGAIDSSVYFLGNFIGAKQYAFDFYRKGEYEPVKTPTDKLASAARFRQVVILVDNATQSSAEIMAATLKKYRVGVVVGIPTKGWGTVEKVFPLDNQIDESEKYSIFLVHSITLRDDNQPIEGRGVEPNINIKDANWENQLKDYYNSPKLLSAVKDVL